MPSSITPRLAERLKSLRLDQGWSLDGLSQRSSISRATLSRMEKAEVSPTAEVLAKICTAYNLSLSRLLSQIEEAFPPLSTGETQTTWRDPASGFLRRNLSPPAENLKGEVLECQLPESTTLSYDAPPTPGLEHHLVLLEGQLTVTIDEQKHKLSPGDCLRYRLNGPSSFKTPLNSAARYHLFLV